MNETYEDVAAIMAEGPGGPNYGRVAGDDGPIDLDPVTPAFLAEGGWGLIETGRGSGGFDAYGAQDMGMTSHRGVLHPDEREYLDEGLIQVMVEKRLGFTYAEVSAAYKNGRPSADQRQLRDRIDSRLLALSRSGGNLLELAKAFGWAVEAADELGGERCKKMERALARARAAI